MPKRDDIKTILIVGSGPIIIGQACEFDYSGTQACKALREHGYRVVLVNSNPATIMTDPEIADATYIEPVNWKTLEKIIAKENKLNFNKYIKYVKDRPFNDFRYSINYNKIKKLGWKPKFNVEDKIFEISDTLSFVFIRIALIVIKIKNLGI